MPSGNLKSVNRRSILKTASALTVPTFLPKKVFGANEKKINIAWVGFGNMGWGDLNNCANGNNVVALCDCNPGTWERAKKKYPKAKFYKDFRKMLEEMGDQIDAVGVGTPDHTHFAITYMARAWVNTCLLKNHWFTHYGKHAHYKRWQKKKRS